MISAPVALTLAGCAGMETTAIPQAQLGQAFTGSVHGGQQPVSGSHVYLFEAGTGSYGATSISLLGTGTSTTGLTADTSGNDYVTTTSTGNFTITNNYSCPANAQVYLLASGGNPGLTAGTNNTAITLMAAVGSCSLLTPTSNIVINEVSTAGAVTALQQFMTSPTQIGVSATNTTGLQNAFLSVSNLVSLASGTAVAKPVSGSGSSPVAKVNTLGNILAPCINSASSTSQQCSSLFSDVKPTGTTAPSDVADAMLAIAKNPGYNVGPLFGLINSSAPFTGLAAAPNDYTLPVTFTVAGLTSPGDVVIDASGNAWTGNCASCNGVAGTDALIGISPTGALAGTVTNGIHQPQGLAFDSLGNLWSTDLTSGSYPDQIVKESTSGVIATGFPYSGSAVSTPLGIAIDATNNAWVANKTGSNIDHISAAGTLLNNTGGSGLLVPVSIAIDGTGVVFTSATGSSDIYKLNPTTSAAASYTSGGINQPLGVAIDGSDNIWTIDNQTNAVSIVNGTTGNAVSSSVGFGVGVTDASVIAIDGVGTAWVANCRASCPGEGSTSPDNLLHFNSAGTQLTTSDGFQDTHLSAAGVAAIDASGNVWVSNNTGASLTEFIGVAAPVKTPLAAAAAGNQLGARP
jgi:streptogramin lyase